MRRSADRDERRAEAAQWIARLSADDLGESDALAFEAWLAAAPENAAAYDAALAVWNDFGVNAEAVLQGLRRERPVRPRPGRAFYLSGGAIAAALAAVAVIAPQFATPERTETYASRAGEHRAVTLADGSRVELNGGTRLSITLKRRERDVTLAEGEAAFDVTHDPRRPFVVDVGDRAIRVVGTEFDVRRRGGRLSVTVARGAVEVAPVRGARGDAYRLHPGQRLDHAEGAPETRVAAVDASDAFAWRTGRLILRGQTLAEVVADLNAQFAKPIRVADPVLAAEPISGVLVLDDESAVVRRLALLVSAQAVPSDGGVVLQRKETPKR